MVNKKKKRVLTDFEKQIYSIIKDSRGMECGTCDGKTHIESIKLEIDPYDGPRYTTEYGCAVCEKSAQDWIARKNGNR